MVRAEIAELVAVTRSRHQTRSVLERYDIFSNEDLKLDVLKREGHHRPLTGTVPVTVALPGKKEGSDQIG